MVRSVYMEAGISRMYPFLCMCVPSATKQCIKTIAFTTFIRGLDEGFSKIF